MNFETAVSIVIPCYNEAKRLEPKLSESIVILKTLIKEPFEIVLVDDGSTDSTYELLKAVETKFSPLPITVVHYVPNQGKGRAVKAGVLIARGAKIVVMDADFSIDLSETTRFLRALDASPVAIGTKKHLLTETVKPQSAPRRFLGKGFTTLTNLFLGMDFTDITCGEKAFRGEAGRNIFGRQRINRWSYDSETLYLARRLHYEVVEIPVKWHHEEESKVKTLRATFFSFFELLAIRIDALLGRYHLKA
jgi:dolichyl-phosphate beta-glucosyltransferase